MCQLLWTELHDIVSEMLQCRWLWAESKLLNCWNLHASVAVDRVPDVACVGNDKTKSHGTC